LILKRQSVKLEFYDVAESNKMLKELMNSYILDKMKDIEYSINTKVMARIGRTNHFKHKFIFR
jgi:hypothetical protein